MIDFFKATFTEFGKDRCTTLAAALAYYTIFSLPPLLFLLVTIVSLALATVPGDQAAEDRAEQVVEQQVEEMVGNESASEAISTMMDRRQAGDGAWWKSLVSIGAILFGATGVVAALQSSLNQVWEVKTDPDEGGLLVVLKKRVLSFGMIVALGFVLVVSLILTTVLTAAGEQIADAVGARASAAQTTSGVVQFLVSCLVFAAIFKFMPDAVVDWKDVMVGALVTAVLFLIGRLGLQLYLGTSNPGAQFGNAASSLAVLLVWVYYSSLIVLYGAEVTQVYATRFGAGILPQDHAVRFAETIRRSQNDETDRRSEDDEPAGEIAPTSTQTC